MNVSQSSNFVKWNLFSEWIEAHFELFYILEYKQNNVEAK